MGKKNEELTCEHDPNWTTPWGRIGTTAIVCISVNKKNQWAAKETHTAFALIQTDCTLMPALNCWVSSFST